MWEPAYDFIATESTKSLSTEISKFLLQIVYFPSAMLALLRQNIQFSLEISRFQNDMLPVYSRAKRLICKQQCPW